MPTSATTACSRRSRRRPSRRSSPSPPGSELAAGIVELRQLGGALGRSTPGHGALDALDGAAVLYMAGTVENEAQRTAVKEQLASIRTAMAPWAAGPPA